MSDLRFEDTQYDGTSTYPLVRFWKRNDIDIHRCWFWGGEVNLRCQFHVGPPDEGGDQANITSCIFEASRSLRVTVWKKA